MKTTSISSTLGELVEQNPVRQPTPNLENLSYQAVAAAVQNEEKAPTGSLPSPSPAPSSVDTPPSPPAALAAAAEIKLSQNPIWDTGWEIEAQTPELGQAAIASLKGLFSKNGLGDDSVKLSYIEELAVCPGVRSWVNRSVVVEYPNGQLEKFSAEWTQKRPEWTLCSMLERLGAEGPIQVVT